MIGTNQLLDLGDGRSIWARHARHEHLVQWLDSGQAYEVYTTTEAKVALLRTLFDTGLMEYMHDHPEATLLQACEVVLVGRLQ